MSEVERYYDRRAVCEFEAGMREEAAEMAEEHRAAWGDSDEVVFAQMRAGVRAFMRHLVSKTLRENWESLRAEGRFSLERLLKEFFIAGRAMGLKEMLGMTMEEEGLMFGESKAAISWRLDQLSAFLKDAGFHGYKLPGQKRETTAYSQAQRRAQEKGANRLGGKRRKDGAEHPTSNTQH